MNTKLYCEQLDRPIEAIKMNQGFFNNVYVYLLHIVQRYLYT